MESHEPFVTFLTSSLLLPRGLSQSWGQNQKGGDWGQGGDPGRPSTRAIGSASLPFRTLELGAWLWVSCCVTAGKSPVLSGSPFRHQTVLNM